MLFAVLVLPSIPPVWGQCLFCEIIREAFKYCLADFVQRGVLWYFSFLPVFSTTWNWHAVWPYGQHSVKVGKTPQEVTRSPVSKWPAWEIIILMGIMKKIRMKIIIIVLSGDEQEPRQQMTGLRDNDDYEDNEEDKNENNHHCYIRRWPGAPSEMTGLRDNHHNEDNEEDKNENNHHSFFRRWPAAPLANDRSER